jgi:low affinity Fe/Cu permease
MVFLIQNTQNRDSEAMHVKLDELIRAIEGAHNALLNLEELDEKELDRIRASYATLAEKARSDLKGGKATQDRPNLSAANNKFCLASSAMDLTRDSQQ